MFHQHQAPSRPLSSQDISREVGPHLYHSALVLFGVDGFSSEQGSDETTTSRLRSSSLMKMKMMMVSTDDQHLRILQHQAADAQTSPPSRRHNDTMGFTGSGLVVFLWTFKIWTVSREEKRETGATTC